MMPELNWRYFIRQLTLDTTLDCSIARTALKILIDEGMIQNSREMGDYFLSELKKIENKNIKEIRGRGLMIAIELYKGTEGGARAIAEQLKKLGILCKETHTYTIRFAPPLVIKKEEIDWALDRIKVVLGRQMSARRVA
jgi:ornithine--oxo-acid transaminase